MGIIDRIAQFRQQGLAEPQIISSLRQEGFTPKEIEESLSQSQIKYALDERSNPSQEQEMASEGMQPSMMLYPEEQTQTIEPPQNQYAPDYSQNQQYAAPYQDQQYQDQGYYQAPGAAGIDIETITEISQQLIDEKLKDLRKEMFSILKIKEDFEVQLKSINAKIEKIENNFNQLQIAVIGKIGEYGKDIKDISKEMHVTQDSFSKILNPLVDNIRELQKITGKEVSKPRPQIEENKQ